MAWINVEDKLPEPNVECICMEDDGEVYRLHQIDGSKYFWDRRGYYYTEVTHWMPLEPITEKEWKRLYECNWNGE